MQGNVVRGFRAVKQVYADARGNFNALALVLHKHMKFCEQGFRPFLKRLTCDGPDEYAKFVAAKPSHRIGIAKNVLDGLAGFQQRGIARDMSKGVVDQFEIVQIKEQQRVCSVRLRFDGHGRAYLVAKGRLVEQVCEAVALRAALKLGASAHFFININNFSHKTQGGVRLADARGLHAAPDIASLGGRDAHDGKGRGFAAAYAPPQLVESRQIAGMHDLPVDRAALFVEQGRGLAAKLEQKIGRAAELAFFCIHVKKDVL